MEQQFKDVRDQYIDYVASKYFEALNVHSVKFETRPVECNGAKVVLVNVSGISNLDGRIVNVDLWPARCQTMKDIAALPKRPSDIQFRIGYHTSVDPITGETKITQGQPKFLKFFNGEEFVGFTGKKAVYNEETGRTEWSNEEPAEEK